MPDTDAAQSPPVAEPVWMTLDEAAEYLRVSRRTFSRLVKADRVPHARFNGRYRFRKSDLTEFVDSLFDA